MNELKLLFSFYNSHVHVLDVRLVWSDDSIVDDRNWCNKWNKWNKIGVKEMAQFVFVLLVVFTIFHCISTQHGA